MQHEVHKPSVLLGRDSGEAHARSELCHNVLEIGTQESWEDCPIDEETVCRPMYDDFWPNFEYLLCLRKRCR